MIFLGVSENWSVETSQSMSTMSILKEQALMKYFLTLNEMTYCEKKWQLGYAAQQLLAGYSVSLSLYICIYIYIAKGSVTIHLPSVTLLSY